MNTKKYFCVEWKRCFQSLYIYAGVAGAWVMWMYSTQGEMMGDVLDCFMLTSQSAGIILVFMLCTLGHGISFFDDTENRYFYYQAVRGSLKRYVIEKSLVVYLSSVFVYVTSQMLFILTLRMRYPWQMPDSAAYRDMVQRSIFGYFLGQGHPICYYLLVGLRTGMFTGVLVLLAVYLSTYLNSKIFMVAVPAIVYQLIRQILSVFVPVHKCLDILFVYGFYSRVFTSDVLSTVWTMTVSFLLSALLIIGIYVRMKKKC